MPYNGSGGFTIPNSFTPATTILSSEVNANFTDIATGLGSVLVRDGQAAMTGALRLADGTEALPGLSFSGDTNTGFRRSATDVMEWVAGGSDRMFIDADGKAWFLGAVDVAGLLSFAAIANTGLHILDTNASHDLIIAPGSDLTADRTLSLVTGDADRALTIGADSSIGGTAYVVGGTDVPVTDGGTGASTAANARANLGLASVVLEGAPARAYDSYATNEDITDVITVDDSIPQNTEGVEILSAAITLKKADSRVRARFQAFGECIAASADDNRDWTAALFKDSTADALAAVNAGITNDNVGTSPVSSSVLEFEHAPGSVGPFTYAIRVGVGTAGETLRLNGDTAGRFYGGVAAATLVLEEVYV